MGVAAAIGLVAALWYVLVPTEPGVVTGSEAPRAVPAVTPGDGAGVAQVSPGPGALPAINRTEEDGKGWFPTDTMATVAARYRAMRDKRHFVDLALKAGGGAHLAYAALAVFHCADVSDNPGAAEKERRKVDLVERPTLHDKAKAQWYDECEGFAKRPFTDSQVNGLWMDFKAVSDPAARALRLAVELPQDRQFARLETHALLAEDDLHLAWWLTGPMAILSVSWPPSPRETHGVMSDAYRAALEAVRVEESAWKLAWCRVGIECDRGTSMAWDMDCIGRKQCGENFAEDAERLAYKDKFDPVLERSRVIEKVIRDRNWRSLGF